MLQKLLVSRLVFTPESEGLIGFRGAGTLKGLLFDGQLSAANRALHQVASLPPVSWNQIAAWLKQIEAVRQAA